MFLISVLVAVVASQIWLTLSLRQQEERTAKIQLIARQKMLVSDVITSVRNWPVSDSASQTREQLAELKSLLEKIKGIHMALINGSELYRINGNNSPEVEALFSQYSPSFVKLNDYLKEIVNAATVEPDKLQSAAAMAAAYSEGVTEIHLKLFQENEQKLRGISLQGWLLMLVTLSGLVLSFILFIKPVVRKMNQQHKELSDMNKTLREMGQMKDDFMATIGNELRAPVEGLSNLVNLMSDTSLNADQQRLLRGIKSGTEHLSRQISDLMDLSKMKKGEFEQVRSRFNLREMMEEVVDGIKPLAHAKNLEVMYEVADDVPAEINQDEFRIRQVLHKLLSNAVKFTERGEVVARLELVNELDNLVHLRFSVRDTGKGMNEQASRDLFRKQMISSTDGQGSGIALSLSKELVNQLGGRIWVDSKPGIGSTFYFTVVGEVMLRIDSREVALKELKALVIDDNKTSLKILVRQLSNWGIQATPFNSPELVAEVFDNLHRFDFCIMDLEMPEMDGRSLARRIREKYPEKEFPIILLSNSGRQLVEDDQSLYSAYLTKPIKTNRLLDTISQVIGISTVELSKLAYQIKGDADTVGPKGLKVLIAQDNELSRAVTNRTLERLGYSCDVATSGQQVLEKVRLASYDVLVMDVRTSDIDGIETTRTLQKTSSRKKLPLIIGIADSPEDGNRGMAAGMDDCINLPKVQDEIESKINAWFENTERD
ncbi:MAG: response regulator [Flavobacteriales bacterium]|nr:response regulator [Flavobacteriales bacterium]